MANIAGRFVDLNPLHPACQNVIVAAVAQPNRSRPRCIYSGQYGSPATTGTDAIMLPVIGIAQKIGSRMNFTDRKNVVVQTQTIAAVVWITSLAAAATPCQYGGNGALVPGVSTAGAMTLSRSTGFSLTSGVILAVETPYFLVWSFNGNPASNSRIAEFYAKNLFTGVVQTDRVTNVSSNVTSVGNYAFGSASGGSSPWLGSISWLLHSGAYLNQAAIQGWGQDPWGIFLTNEFSGAEDVFLSTSLGGAIGIATETDTALPLSRTKSRAIGIASESDTAIAFARKKARAIGIASEADSALTLGRKKARSVGIAVEADTALAVGRRKSRTLGIATESNAALSLGRLKSRLLGTALETDLALALARLTRDVLDPAFLFEPEAPLSLFEPEAPVTFFEPDGEAMEKARAVRSTDKPKLAVSFKKYLARMNEFDVASGGAGDVTLIGVAVSIEAHTKGEADPSATSRLFGSYVKTDPYYVSQFVTGGIDGAFYVVSFEGTFSNNEKRTIQVELPVSRFI